MREVLRRDFLDVVRSKRATTSVCPDDERADGQGLSESTIDQRVANYGNPEDEHLQSELQHSGSPSEKAALEEKA